MNPLEKLLARMAELRDELETLNTDDIDEEGETRFAELTEEFTGLEETRVQIVERNVAVEAVRSAAADPRNVATVNNVLPVPDKSANPFDLSDLRYNTTPGELRDRAMTAVERVHDVPSDAREEMTRKLESVPDPQGVIPQLILYTSADAYRSAFAKAMAGMEALFTADEAAAVGRVDSFRAAFGLTQSGYASPAVVDPSVILSSDGSTNPFRVVSRVETLTTGNSWKPITSAAISASFDVAGVEVSDDTPTFAQPEITVYKAQAFAQGQIEAVEDWAGIGAELGREFADAKDQLEAAAFATGSGSNQPTGITKALDGVTTPVELAPATAEVFAIADVYAVVKSVPPRHRGPGASNAVLANLGTIMKIRQFGTSAPSTFLNDLGAGQPASLLGYPLYEASTMRDYDLLDAGATADNFLIVAGDWNKYVIVDRIGLSVEFIPHLFSTTTNLPNGTRGWYAHWRVGADSIVDTAFSMLSIPTAA